MSTHRNTFITVILMMLFLLSGCGFFGRGKADSAAANVSESAVVVPDVQPLEEVRTVGQSPDNTLVTSSNCSGQDVVTVVKTDNPRKKNEGDVVIVDVTTADGRTFPAQFWGNESMLPFKGCAMYYNFEGSDNYYETADAIMPLN